MDAHPAFISVTPRNTNRLSKPWFADVMTEAAMVFRGIVFGVLLSLIMWMMAVALIANMV